MNTTAKRAVTACTVAIATMAVAASAATAAPAAFNVGGSFQLGSSTSLVVKVGTTPTAATTYTCAPAGQTWGNTSVVSAYGWVSGFDATAACSNGLGASGTLTLSRGHSYTLQGEKNGGVYSLTAQNGMLVRLTRHGSSTVEGTASLPTSYSVAWTNGTFGGAPSTAAFNNAPITSIATPAALAGQPITLTGTISINPPFGVPLLLS